MKRILAAVDLSANADAVVARAAELALAVDGRVRVIHAVPHGAPAAFDVHRFDALLPESVRDGVVVAQGDVADAVIAAAQQYAAELVVIGAHSYRWAERVLGTTAAAIVNRIDRPLLVVRPNGPVKAAIFPLVAELRAQQARLDCICTGLLDAYREGDWRDVDAEWDVFEPLLRAHMAHEEITWIPLFREVDRAETDALLADHVELRRLLESVGPAFERHTRQLPDGEALIESLRAHALREERRFYPWIAARGEAITVQTDGPVPSEQAS